MELLAWVSLAEEASSWMSSVFASKGAFNPGTSGILQETPKAALSPAIAKSTKQRINIKMTIARRIREFVLCILPFPPGRPQKITLKAVFRVLLCPLATQPTSPVWARYCRFAPQHYC